MSLLRSVKKASDWLGVSNSFALANICAFLSSGSLAGTSLAILTGLVAWRAGVYAARQGKAPNAFARAENAFFSRLQHLLLGRGGRAANLGLRVNAAGIGVTAAVTGVLAPAGAGGVAAALFPVLAGGFFAVGNYFGSSERAQAIQSGTMPASAFVRAATNPAVYYGMGYMNLGLLAGGGLGLFAHPLANIPALCSTFLSSAATVTSIAGLLCRKIQNPAPFMFVAHSTAFNMLSAAFTANPVAALNNAFACHGEVRLGMILREDTADRSRLPPPPLKGAFARHAEFFFKRVSYAACWPVRAMDRFAPPSVS